jgi:hypothetical protein
MDQKIKTHIFRQPVDRRDSLLLLHKIIVDNDSTVAAEIGLMMGKEMVIYKANGMMKYALASVKNYMSLHVLPMYMNNSLFEKYKVLLPKAKFQKGCINFDTVDAVPLNIVGDLIVDCSPIDLVAIREKYLADKKSKLTAKAGKKNRR